MHIGFLVPSSPCTNFKNGVNPPTKKYVTFSPWRRTPLGLMVEKGFITWLPGLKKGNFLKMSLISPPTLRHSSSGRGHCQSVVIPLSTELVSISIPGSLLTLWALMPSLTNEACYSFFSCCHTTRAYQGNGGAEKSNPRDAIWDEVPELFTRREKALSMRSYWEKRIYRWLVLY